MTDKGFVWEASTKNRSAHMGFVVIKFSIHLIIMIFKWLVVKKKERCKPGCKLFLKVFVCIQMYYRLKLMVHVRFLHRSQAKS